MNRNSLFVVGGVVLLALALGLAWMLRPAPAAKSGDIDAVLAAVERVAAAQERQDARLARLEGQGATGGMGAGSSGRGPGPAGAGPRGGNGNAVLDPAQAEARFQAQLRALDDKLVSEPLSAAWATKQEKVVSTFLSPANLAREGVTAPKSSETRCQSKMCRIRMTFADAQEAERTQGALLMGIAEGLPHAQTFVLPRPDGQVDLVMFASGDPQALR